MDLQIEMQMISMPDSILLKSPAPGVRQDGFDPGKVPSIPVKELTKEQAEQYAEEMKQAFIANWSRLKNG